MCKLLVGCYLIDVIFNIAEYPNLWKREMFEALDVVRSEVERRFDQEGLRIAAGREQAVLEAAQGNGLMWVPRN
ncbi:Hypothetical protein FKW44_005306 [Caligus rogercresseyi]|uniref:Uncharacterized protein n=1 Tax=Caligus rogercresseyi TaxID=217165 RepID=A0A7T8KBT1_CALRO|nr:Hypothetical protein FKW44_005306 [Caligus rogercresseyi]